MFIFSFETGFFFFRILTLVELFAREAIDVNSHPLQVSFSFHSGTAHLAVYFLPLIL